MNRLLVLVWLAVGCGPGLEGSDGLSDTMDPLASGRVHLGVWGGDTPNHPGENTTENFERWERDIGGVMIYRSRGGEGELDDTLLLPGTLDKAREGHIVSLQFQPKVGTGAQRHGLCYENTYRCVAAGQFDAEILAKLAELKALPGTTRHPFEVHSECNIQHGRIDAQPITGAASDYPAFFRKIHELAVKAGVRNRLLFTVSMTRGPWDGNEWRTWTHGIEDLIDLVATDGYSQPDTGTAKSLASVIEPMLAVSTALGGKRIAVMETGSQEAPGNAGYKAAWYADALAAVKANRLRLYTVVFNTSNDGPGGFYPDTTARSKAAFTAMAQDAVWTP